MPRCPLRWAGNRDRPLLGEMMSRLPGSSKPARAAVSWRVMGCARTGTRYIVFGFEGSCKARIQEQTRSVHQPRYYSGLGIRTP